MTQQFAKFIDENTILRPHKHLKTPNLIAFNFDQNETLLREQGYLELVELNNPEDVTDETHWAKPQYALIQAEEDGKDVSYITVQYQAEEITDEVSE